MATLNSYRDKNVYYHHSIDISPEKELANAHFHDKYEILMILSGRGTFCAEGRKYVLGKDKIFITRPGETHFVTVSEGEPYERVAIHFSPTLLEGKPDFFSAPFDSRPVGQKNEYSMKQIGLSAAMLASIPDHIKGALLSAYVQSRGVSFLCDLSQTLAQGRTDNVEEVAEPCEELSLCLDYINDNIFSKIALEDVAKAGYLSMSQLCRLFKSKLGTTVHDYIKNKKLIAAKQMLLDGDDPANVAKKCGFGSYTAFYRAYHESFGTSPSGISRKSKDFPDET